jgi:hypothetical protein
MDLLEAVTVTFELVGQAVSDASLKAIVQELVRYPEADVLEALTRCRRECRKLSLADILDRIPGQHPKPEEAWALVSRCLVNEQVSVVWTDEMREAYGVAAALADDPVAARMAFRESYSELVSRARAKNQAPTWTVSLGTDPAGRELALQEAVKKNQISQAHAAALVPHLEPVSPAVQALITQVGK